MTEHGPSGSTSPEFPSTPEPKAPIEAPTRQRDSFAMEARMFALNFVKDRTSNLTAAALIKEADQYANFIMYGEED